MKFHAVKSNLLSVVPPLLYYSLKMENLASISMIFIITAPSIAGALITLLLEPL